MPLGYRKPSGIESFIIKIFKQMEELKILNDKYFENFVRLSADFENYKRNTDKKLQEQLDNGKIELFVSLCDFIDDMFRSEENGHNQLLCKKLIKTLNDAGFEMYGEVGEDFDEDKHDAISAMSNKYFLDNSIIGIHQMGWKYNGKIIRYAKVIVNKL